MGGAQTAPSAVGVESGYKRYLIEMQRQPMSEIPPYRPTQIAYLKSLFEELDSKKHKYIDVSDFDNYYTLKQHPLYERIREVFREEVQKIKNKKITFDIMLYLLSIFHIETPIDEKYRFVFRLYDIDKDQKISVQDLCSVFQILFYGNMYNESTYLMMAEQVVSDHGAGGYLRFQQFVAMLPQDQLRELMTLRFIEL